jgi:tRNA acetyltransferase TAN1
MIFIRVKSDESVIAFIRRLIDNIKSDLYDVRHIQRVIPLEIICLANLNELEMRAEPLIRAHFKNSQPPCKFAILFRSRNTQKLQKEETIRRIAAMVDPPHTVDLENPDKMIVIEAFKNLVGMGIVEDYYSLKRYNLNEISVQSRVNSMFGD